MAGAQVFAESDHFFDATTLNEDFFKDLPVLRRYVKVEMRTARCVSAFDVNDGPIDFELPRISAPECYLMNQAILQES